MKDMPHEELAGVFHHPCQSQGREVSGGKFYIRSYLFVYVLDKQKPLTGTIPHNLQNLSTSADCTGLKPIPGLERFVHIPTISNW